MALQIVPYTEDHIPAVAAFNERARAHHAPFLLSNSPVATWLPRREEPPLFREFFLAVDGDGVHGGYTLRRQDFWLGGVEVKTANYQGPLSEGIWDRRYMMTGVQMLRTALRDQPLMYALGMGGLEQPLPKMLASAGWQLVLVPFCFKVLRGAAFLRHLQPLRRKRGFALLADLGAATGIGAVAIHALQYARARYSLPSNASAEHVPTFGEWADIIWEAGRDEYQYTAIRDRKNQQALFGDGNEKNIILRCREQDRDIGWVVVRSTAMQGDKYFGDMRLGSLIDCFARPGSEACVVALATRHLRSLASDLVVTNQTHERWNAALRQCGYATGPSNFALACSPALIEQIGPLAEVCSRIHFTRADGDGPIHL